MYDVPLPGSIKTKSHSDMIEYKQLETFVCPAQCFTYIVLLLLVKIISYVVPAPPSLRYYS